MKLQLWAQPNASIYKCIHYSYQPPKRAKLAANALLIIYFWLPIKLARSEDIRNYSALNIGNFQDDGGVSCDSFKNKYLFGAKSGTNQNLFAGGRTYQKILTTDTDCTTEPYPVMVAYKIETLTQSTVTVKWRTPFNNMVWKDVHDVFIQLYRSSVTTESDIVDTASIYGVLEGIDPTDHKITKLDQTTGSILKMIDYPVAYLPQNTISAALRKQSQSNQVLMHFMLNKAYSSETNRLSMININMTTSTTMLKSNYFDDEYYGFGMNCLASQQNRDIVHLVGSLKNELTNSKSKMAYMSMNSNTLEIVESISFSSNDLISSGFDVCTMALVQNVQSYMFSIGTIKNEQNQVTSVNSTNSNFLLKVRYHQSLLINGCTTNYRLMRFGDGTVQSSKWLAVNAKYHDGELYLIKHQLNNILRNDIDSDNFSLKQNEFRYEIDISKAMSNESLYCQQQNIKNEFQANLQIMHEENFQSTGLTAQMSYGLFPRSDDFTLVDLPFGINTNLDMVNGQQNNHQCTRFTYYKGEFGNFEFGDRLKQCEVLIQDQAVLDQAYQTQSLKHTEAAIFQSGQFQLQQLLVLIKKPTLCDHPISLWNFQPPIPDSTTLTAPVVVNTAGGLDSKYGLVEDPSLQYYTTTINSDIVKTFTIDNTINYIVAIGEQDLYAPLTPLTATQQITLSIRTCENANMEVTYKTDTNPESFIESESTMIKQVSRSDSPAHFMIDHQQLLLSYISIESNIGCNSYEIENAYSDSACTFSVSGHVMIEDVSGVNNVKVDVTTEAVHNFYLKMKTTEGATSNCLSKPMRVQITDCKPELADPTTIAYKLAHVKDLDSETSVYDFFDFSTKIIVTGTDEFCFAKTTLLHDNIEQTASFFLRASDFPERTVQLDPTQAAQGGMFILRYQSLVISDYKELQLIVSLCDTLITTQDISESIVFKIGSGEQPISFSVFEPFIQGLSTCPPTHVRLNRDSSSSEEFRIIGAIINDNDQDQLVRVQDEFLASSLAVNTDNQVFYDNSNQERQLPLTVQLWVGSHMKKIRFSISMECFNQQLTPTWIDYDQLIYKYPREQGIETIDLGALINIETDMADCYQETVLAFTDSDRTQEISSNGQLTGLRMVSEREVDSNGREGTKLTVNKMIPVGDQLVYFSILQQDGQLQDLPQPLSLKVCGAHTIVTKDEKDINQIIDLRQEQLDSTVLGIEVEQLFESSDPECPYIYGYSLTENQSGSQLNQKQSQLLELSEDMKIRLDLSKREDIEYTFFIEASSISGKSAYKKVTLQFSLSVNLAPDFSGDFQTDFSFQVDLPEVQSQKPTFLYESSEIIDYEGNNIFVNVEGEYSAISEVLRVFHDQANNKVIVQMEESLLTEASQGSYQVRLTLSDDGPTPRIDSLRFITIDILLNPEVFEEIEDVQEVEGEDEDPDTQQVEQSSDDNENQDGDVENEEDLDDLEESEQDSVRARKKQSAKQIAKSAFSGVSPIQMAKLQLQLDKLAEQQQNEDEQIEIKPITLKVLPMKTDGIIRIAFSQSMLIPTNIILINYSEVFDLYLIDIKTGDIVMPNQDNQRQLADQQEEEEENNEDTSKLNFKWQVIDHSEKLISLELYFDNPQEVSNSVYGRDKIIIQFKDLSKFISQETGLNLDNLAFGGAAPRFKIPLGPIETNPQSSQSIGQTTGSIGDILNSLQSGNFFLSILMGGSMQQLWTMIRALQLIVLSSLIEILFPPNATVFYQAAITFSNIDLLDGKELYKNVLEMKETEPLSPKFYEMDFEDKNFINNSGSFFILMALILAQTILRKIINQICILLARFTLFRKIGAALYKEDSQGMLKSGILRLFLETYFEMTMCSYLQMVAFRQSKDKEDLKQFFGNLQNNLASIGGMVMLIIVVLAPFYLFKKLKKQDSDFSSKEFNQTYSVLIKDIDTSSLAQQIYQVTFIARRLILVSVLILLREQSFFQCTFLYKLSLLNLYYLTKYRPLEDERANRIEIFNESIIFITCNLVNSFLNASLDLDFREQMGLALIWFSCFNVFVNMALMGYNMLIDLGYSFYLRYQIHKVNETTKQQLKSKEDFAEQFPQSMNKFVEVKQELEALEFCRIWVPQRKWLVSNKVSLDQFLEEKQYQDYVKKFKIKDRAHQQKIVKSQIIAAEKLKKWNFKRQIVHREEFKNKLERNQEKILKKLKSDNEQMSQQDQLDQLTKIERSGIQKAVNSQSQIVQNSKHIVSIEKNSKKKKKRVQRIHSNTKSLIKKKVMQTILETNEKSESSRSISIQNLDSDFSVSCQNESLDQLHPMENSLSQNIEDLQKSTLAWPIQINKSEIITQVSQNIEEYKSIQIEEIQSQVKGKKIPRQMKLALKKESDKLLSISDLSFQEKSKQIQVDEMSDFEFILEDGSSSFKDNSEIGELIFNNAIADQDEILAKAKKHSHLNLLGDKSSNYSLVIALQIINMIPQIKLHLLKLSLMFNEVKELIPQEIKVKLNLLSLLSELFLTMLAQADLGVSCSQKINKLIMRLQKLVEREQWRDAQQILLGLVRRINEEESVFYEIIDKDDSEDEGHPCILSLFNVVLINRISHERKKNRKIYQCYRKSQKYLQSLKVRIASESFESSLEMTQQPKKVEFTCKKCKLSEVKADKTTKVKDYSEFIVVRVEQASDQTTASIPLKTYAFEQIKEVNFQDSKPPYELVAFIFCEQDQTDQQAYILQEVESDSELVKQWVHVNPSREVLQVVKKDDLEQLTSRNCHTLVYRIMDQTNIQVEDLELFVFQDDESSCSQ